MKKVMITISTLYGGGAERVVSIWASQLCEQGYDVSILIYGRGKGEYYIPGNVRIYTVADTYGEYQKMGYLSRFKKMRSIIRSVRPNVMINFLPRMQIWVLFASAFMSTFRIETVRVSPWEVCKDNAIEKFLWKQCFRVADAVILQTKEQGEFFGEGVNKKAIVIPNPISDQCISNYKQSFSDNPKLFVAAGRLTPQKNYPMMINAFAEAYKKNKNIRLSIYGSGSGNNDPYPLKLQRQIDELGLSDIVKLEGRTDKIIEKYNENDAFLMTSDFEGMPNALAEAMACGLVCISTNCKTGPADMIINNKNGYLVDVHDVHAMTNAISDVSSMSKEKAKTMGQAARETILKMCSEDQSRNSLIALIERA